jgi:RimJ/RimL family protein N-acetyltransferase
MLEIDYSKYYWKNSLVGLRHGKYEDWEEQIHNNYDNIARFFFNEEIELPVDIEAFKRCFIHDGSRPQETDRTFLGLVIENNDGKHVGVMNVFGIDERNGRFGVVGIQINPQDRNKGYGAAAYRLLGKYMFKERRMHKWNNGYMEENKASEALHKKLGFKIEGVQRDMYFHEGRYWNQVLCGMTEAEFFENEKHLPLL